MIKDEEQNIIYFESDDEFYEFCVKPELIPIKYKSKITNNDKYYVDFEFSKEYQEAIKNNTKFIIKDENSQILKHGKVSYRTITKPISNLEPYYKEI